VKWLVEFGVEMEMIPESELIGHPSYDRNLCQEAAELHYWDIVHFTISKGCPCPLIVQYQLLNLQLQKELVDIQNDLSTIQQHFLQDSKHQTTSRLVENVKQKVSSIKKELLIIEDLEKP
jgi:hypothetical protein